MNKLVTAGVIAFALASAQAIGARWLPSPLASPIIPAVLIALLDVLPPRTSITLTLLGGFAAELGSGLPLGVVFTVLVSVVELDRALLRHLNIGQSIVAKATVSGLSFQFLQSVLFLVATGGRFMDIPTGTGSGLQQLVLAGLWSATLTAFMSRLVSWGKRRQAVRLAVAG